MFHVAITSIIVTVNVISSYVYPVVDACSSSLRALDDVFFTICLLYCGSSPLFLVSSPEHKPDVSARRYLL